MPKIDTQMIDQLQFALLVNTGKERHLGIGRPRCTSEPPELLQMPPMTDAPIHDEPITECGSRPSGLSAFSSA
ncbi:Uncharacterised protein [Salmonella enterica subsp. enterica]|uniref:Uncharacterized protein n=1 Tax=Salmonella enterica I TaxID=59201 RepID=A0A447N7R8_SALET|nr:Uncharacterised protein [Salmonella enterica subsp. enterica]